MIRNIPKMFRAMTPDGAEPKIGRTRRCLGVVLGPRPKGDIEPDARGEVHPATGGMSVAPTWADLPSWRVPQRLSSKIRGATGPNADQIWSLGTQSFTDAAITADLRLRVDRPGHGNVEPDARCALHTFETNLGGTRPSWVVDEP